jgi:hypothetical protein
MTREEVARYLETASVAYQVLGNPGADVACKLLHFAATAIAMGKDPITHLSRLTDLDPQFDAISKAADAAAAEKFRGVK